MPGMIVGYMSPIWSVLGLFCCGDIKSTSSSPDFPERKKFDSGVKQQRGTVIRSTEFVREEARFSCDSLLLTENFQTASNKSQNSEKEARYVQ